MFRFYMGFKVASKRPPGSIKQASPLFLRFAVDFLIVSCGIVCAMSSTALFSSSIVAGFILFTCDIA